MGTLNLNEIVNVSVLVSPLAAPRSTFNQMLVIGSAGVIDTDERVREYSSASAMLEDGFDTEDIEYLAAQKYFSQSPAPTKIWIGAKGVSPEETFIDALEACRQASSEWYVAVCPDAVKEDHLLCATWAEAAVPSSIYAFTTSDADVITDAEDDIFSLLKALSYKRTIGEYSTNPLAICAIMGYAMGANTGLANSSYTLKFKGQVGIAVDSLTSTQVGRIDAKNGNCYVNYGNYYNIFKEGVMANGYFFDEVLNLDMLVNDIQLNEMDLLYQNPKIPQTDAGQSQLIAGCVSACELAVDRGFLAPGVWKGQNILNLQYGDTLSKGYACMSESYSEQTQADREARKAMPIYVAIKEAGAVHSLVIGVYVNR